MLTAAGVANALIFLDQTSVTVALPAIQDSFDGSTHSRAPLRRPPDPS